MAASELPSEWAVGQDKVSTSNLQPTAPPQAPAELTIADAASQALRYNLGFRQAMQNLLAARSAWWSARQQWRFTAFGTLEHDENGGAVNSDLLGTTFQYSATSGATLSVTAELGLVESEQERTISLTATQPLLRGSGKASAVYEQLRSARNAYRSALLSFFLQRQALIAQVINSYFSAAQQRELLRIQNDSVKLAEQAVRDAQIRLENQLIAEIDLTRAQLQLSRAQTDAVLAQQAEQNTMDALMRVLGLQVEGHPTLVTAVPYAPAAVDLPASVARALGHRPELMLADLTIENQQAALRIARSQRQPALDVFAGLDRVGDGVSERIWKVGLQLSAPISSRTLAAAVQQADWGLLVSLQNRLDLTQEVIAEVRSEARAADAAQKNADIAAQAVEVARRSLYIANRIVEEGLGTNRDLIDAQTNLTASEVSLVTSRINYYLATVRLRQAMGVDIAQDLPTARASAETPAPAPSAPSQPTPAPAPDQTGK
jgi:outer membrane protein TolC